VNVINKCGNLKGKLAGLGGILKMVRVCPDFQKWRYFCCDTLPYKDIAAIYGRNNKLTRNMNEKKLLQRKITVHVQK
jgi:hypothetical protein